MFKYVSLVVILLWSTISFGQKHKLKKDVAKVVQMLNAKNVDGLLAIMADSCRIGNLPPMNNKLALSEILSKYDSLSSFEIVDDRISEEGERQIDLSVRYAKGGEGKPFFKFNRLGKLTNLGIIKARLKADAQGALDDALLLAQRPDKVNMPFLFENGLIYIRSTLNGMDGYFMFDSGAPVIILDKAFVSAEKLDKEVSVDYTGMGGKMEDVSWTRGNELNCHGLVLSSFDAPAAPMGKAVASDGLPIFGLLGYGITRDYQITFDYLAQQILLEKVDRHGNIVAGELAKGTRIAQVRFEMKRHIPIVDITVDGKAYPMGVDCGANANVMVSRLTAELAAFTEYEEQEVSMNGVGEKAEKTSAGYLHNADIGGLALQEMYTAFTTQDIGGGKGDDALPIVGLLGTPFLYQFKMTFNFVAKVLTIYENTSSNEADSST